MMSFEMKFLILSAMIGAVLIGVVLGRSSVDVACPTTQTIIVKHEKAAE